MNSPRAAPRILVTGRSGQVSWELLRTLQCLGEVIALGRDKLDLIDPAAIRTVVQELKPQVIVNAAAYTAVDKAESEPELARAINTIAPAVLAEAAKAVGAMLIHYSTDYVFDGQSSIPYGEDAPTNPRNVYGITKLEGEQAIGASGVQYLILRTSWVYGARGHNFLRTILRLAREREELRVVDDQVGAPTWCRIVAEATAHILAQHLSPMRGSEADTRLNRVYHLAAGGSTSWYGFARAFIDLAVERGDPLALQRLIAVPGSEYPTAAIRPPCSLLSSQVIADAYGVRLPDWKVLLQLAMEKV